MNLTQHYTEVVAICCKPLPPKEQVDHALFGMMDEAGELAALYKRCGIYGKPFDVVNLLEEAGDWLWYFGLLLRELRVSAERIEILAYKALGNVPASASMAEQKELVKVLFTLTAGMVTEVDTEEAENYQSLSRNISAQAADAMVYALGTVLALLRAHGKTLSDALEMNKVKLLDPDKGRYKAQAYSAEAALNRDTSTERQSMESHVAGDSTGQ